MHGMGTLWRLRGMGTLRALKDIPDGPKADAGHGNPEGTQGHHRLS